MTARKNPSGGEPLAEFGFFHKRILYYTSQGYVSQIDKGVRYDKLKPVYFIGILEFEIGQNPNYFSRHKVLDVETKEQIIQLMLRMSVLF